MIIILNGAFGIGKTTVARLLRKRLPGAMVFDPELAGMILQRSARVIGRRVDDFQDLRAWRSLTVAGIRAGGLAARNVIVPMALSNVSYLGEIKDAVRRFDRDVVHVCLVAPVDVVHARLESRGANQIRNAWEFRRAAECCAAHASAAFATHIDATPPAAEVAAIVRQKLQDSRSTSISGSV